MERRKKNEYARCVVHTAQREKAKRNLNIGSRNGEKRGEPTLLDFEFAANTSKFMAARKKESASGT